MIKIIRLLAKFRWEHEYSRFLGKKVITRISIRVWAMIFEQLQTGLVFVIRLNTILGFRYRASTRPRQQTFMIWLENESRVGTPIRRNLVGRSYSPQLFSLTGLCRFGIQCVEAHSQEELREWKERFEYRQKKAQKAAKLYGKSFAELVLEKISAAKNKDAVRIWEMLTYFQLALT